MGTTRPGLVSVTFRSLAAEEIVALAARAGLAGIEWGGDIHVPHGDVARARQVAALTTDAGLVVAAYGSYYLVGPPSGDGPTFEAVLETAVALGAPAVRVWAGDRASTEVDAAYRAAVTADARRIADLAAAARMTVAFEFHGGSLTDTGDSARRLLSDVDRPNVASLWQPPVGAQTEECVASLAAVLPWLANLHVFHRWPTTDDRRPLAEGADRWRRYLSVAASAAGDRFALLEFLPGDDPLALPREAGTLRHWLDQDR